MVTLLVRHDRTVTVACADTSELLDAVECKIGVPRWATWLCFAGKKLEAGKSLTHYGLCDGSTEPLLLPQPPPRPRIATCTVLPSQRP